MTDRGAARRPSRLDSTTTTRARRSVLLALALTAASCGGGPDAALELHVFAASSLTEAFADIGRAFEGVESGVDVVLTYAGSQTLRLQIEHGARAHLFASADEDHVRALDHAGLVAADTVIAWNDLVVIVPVEGGPVERFDDLRNPHRLVIGDGEVPVGRYTDRLLDRIANRDGPDSAELIRGNVASREGNVRLVRAKVALGEADAAIVYRTDVLDSSSVRPIVVPGDLAVRASYHLARLAATSDGSDEVARRFVAYVLSPEGRRALARHGFTVTQ